MVWAGVLGAKDDDTRVDMGGSSQLETSERSADSFYETVALNSEYAKRWKRETETSEFPICDQSLCLTTEKSSLSAKVSVLKSVVSQKETDISLLDSRATYLKSALDDSTCCLVDEAQRIREAQQEAQAQVLYNRVAELEAHVMDVSGCLEREFYPAYLAFLAGRRWLLTHGMELAMVKCLKSPEYQGILGHLIAGHGLKRLCKRVWAAVHGA
ncbi:hypothetical protein Tco_0328029 [Tanacetum coccineum]